MHKIWNYKLMDDNLTDKGYTVFGINESEIIGNNDVIYWMFGIIDRITKESRLFCVLNDITTNNLI